MLLSAPYSAERFSAPVSGLRSLLVAPDAGRGVVTRAAVVASRCYGGGEGVKDSGDDGTNIGHSEDIRKSNDDEEEKDMEEKDKEAGNTEEDEEYMEAKDKEAGSTEEDEELEGFWVSYGRRRPRRRLPPPIPSLVARGALRRTRTADGRLVIRIVPAVRPECIRARRRGDRLTMQVVEHEEDSPMMAPPLREPSSAREDKSIIVKVAQADDDGTDTPAVREGVDDVEVAVAAPEPETTAPAVPPPRVSSAGCFEDVFKFDSIGSSSLHQMPSLRMVH